MQVVSGKAVAGVEPSGHEQVVHAHDETSGLQAIVAIHSTILGPALGGTRFYPYPDEAAALDDVLRLSEGMTFKSAAAGLSLGGGKAVIIGHPDVLKSEDLLEAYGRLIDSLEGRYVTAEDVGTTVEDMVVVRRQTRWVSGLPIEMGGSGDPSPLTARGVVAAMRAVSAHLWGTTSLAGRTVAVQGVGKVGASLVHLLGEHGCDVVIADVDDVAVERLAADTPARAVRPDEILSTPCDILAPCALGAVIDDDTAGTLRCRAIVGSANNQLAPGFDPARLAGQGIVYAPDYLANAGGIVNISVELEPGGYSRARAEAAVDRIFETVTDVLVDAARRGCTPHEAGAALVRGRLRTAAVSRGRE